jgi:hypothetical protein
MSAGVVARSLSRFFFLMALKELFFGLSPLKRFGILVMVILLIVIILLGLVAALRARLAERQFLLREGKLIEQTLAAESRAKIAESRARELAARIAVLDALIAAADERAAQLETDLMTARGVTAGFRREYEKLRNRPIDRSLPVPSGTELCTRLEASGFSCP